MGWWLSEAAGTFRRQVDKRWPNRDHASDGTIGDAAHTTGDHVPDPTSNPPDVVRALDLDADLNKRRGTMGDLTGQLRRYCKAGKANGRVAYIIYDGLITSGTYQSEFWTWRPYSGSNPHTGHAHISFAKAGDHRGGTFDLPIFDTRRRVLRKSIAALSDQIEVLRRRRARKKKRLAVLLRED